MVRYLVQKNFDRSFIQKFVWNTTDLSVKELIKDQKKFTLYYSRTAFIKTKHIKNKPFFIKTLDVNLNIKIKNRIKHSQHLNREIYDFLNQTTRAFNTKVSQRLLLLYLQTPHFTNVSINKLNTLFDINFLRKEKIYTKLKYSRVPQYDAVSGGSAAILAGFLGYLITEKFGLELLDSGDFWFLFMYIVFIIFSFYPLLKITTNTQVGWSSCSYKWCYFYYNQILLLAFNFFRCYAKKLSGWVITWLSKWK